eukprot:3324740-Pyramimonas_sp.AAC.2
MGSSRGPQPARAARRSYGLAPSPHVRTKGEVSYGQGVSACLFPVVLPGRRCLGALGFWDGRRDRPCWASSVS